MYYANGMMAFRSSPQLGNVSVVFTLNGTSAVVGITIKLILSLHTKRHQSRSDKNMTIV